MPQRRIRSTAPVAGAVRRREVHQSEASKFVNGLVNFAGAAAPLVTQELNKKIEADKAIQMARTWQGQGPTDDATVAGYQASYLVAARMQGLRAAKDLQRDPRLGEYTDEEFEAKIADGMGSIQSSLAANYPALKEDPELAKAFSLQMTEMMPAVVDSRQSAQIQVEQKRRYQDTYAMAYDTIVDSAESHVPAELNALMNTTHLLQMSEVEREKMLVELATNTGNLGVFEFAKQYNGQSDSSFFSRSGAMQQLEKMTKTKLTHQKELEFWTDKSALLDQYTSGTLTEDEFKKNSVILEEKYGKGLDQGEFRAALAARDKQVATENMQDGWLSDLKDGKFVGFTKPDGSTASKAEISAFHDRAASDAFGSHMDAIEAADNPEGRANGAYHAAVDRAWQASIKATDDVADASGEVSSDFVRRLNNIIRLDPARDLVDSKGPDGVTRSVLPGVSRTAAGVIYEGIADDFNLLVRLPRASLPKYASGTNLEILQRMRGHMDQGASPAEAITQARYDVRKGPASVSSEHRKNMEALMDNLDNDWVFRTKVPDSARDMLVSDLAAGVINFDNATFQKEVALEALKNEYTFLEDGSPIKGKPGQLQASLAEELVSKGLVSGGTNFSLDEYFETAREFMLPAFQARLRKEGFKADDIQFKVEDGYVTFVTGETTLPHRYSLGRFGAMVYQYRKDQHKPITVEERKKASRDAAIASRNRPGRVPTQ